VRWFEEFENTGTDACDRSNRDRDYVTGIHGRKAELKALADRHQPITINYCSRKVDSCGIERKSRTDPKAYPQPVRRGQGVCRHAGAFHTVVEQA
jgi:hypothetical protein